jgi:prepilin-type N-terminal cleavage/methylation domain-containing protein
MLVCSQFKARGDTLVEVLFAVAIFSLVAVGGLSIMNQGSATSERALEITLVRNEIDAQAETLRFLDASYIAAYQSGVTDYSSDPPAQQWQLLRDNVPKDVTVSPFGAGLTCPKSLSDIKGNGFYFIMNTHSAEVTPLISGFGTNFESASTFSQVHYDYDTTKKVYTVSMADGVWIEAVRSAASNQANADYIDFNIRACWDSPGQSAPMTIGTIVRLYEPKG